MANISEDNSIRSVIKHLLKQAMGPLYDLVLLWPELVIHPKKTAKRMSVGELKLEKALTLATVSFLVPVAVIQFFYPEYKTDNMYVNTLYNMVPVLNALLIYFALKYVLKIKEIQPVFARDLSAICIATAAVSPFYFCFIAIEEDPPHVHIVLFSAYFGLLAKDLYSVSLREAYKIAISAQFLVVSFPIMAFVFYYLYELLS